MPGGQALRSLQSLRARQQMRPDTSGPPNSRGRLSPHELFLGHKRESRNILRRGGVRPACAALGCCWRGSGSLCLVS